MPGGGKGGGSSSSTVTVHNGPITVDSDSTVSVVGLDNISLKSDSKQELTVQPLKTESDIDLETKSEITSKSDITTDSKSDSRNALAVDLKPVSVDLCMNTSTKLPQGTIHQPFNVHFGFTLFGVELFGMNYGGDSRITMQDLPKRPAVDWPAQQNAPAGSESCTPQREGPSVHERGLRVRVR